VALERNKKAGKNARLLSELELLIDQLAKALSTKQAKRDFLGVVQRTIPARIPKRLRCYVLLKVLLGTRSKKGIAFVQHWSELQSFIQASGVPMPEVLHAVNMFFMEEPSDAKGLHKALETLCFKAWGTGYPKEYYSDLANLEEPYFASAQRVATQSLKGFTCLEVCSLKFHLLRAFLDMKSTLRLAEVSSIFAQEEQVQKVFELRRIGTVTKTFITEPDSLGRKGYGFIAPAWPTGLVLFFHTRQVELSIVVREGMHVKCDIEVHWLKGVFKGFQATKVHVLPTAAAEEIRSSLLHGTAHAAADEVPSEEVVFTLQASVGEESSDSFGSSGSWSSSGSGGSSSTSSN